MLAGQNKHWGNVEKATKFWQELGVNHLMIKSTEDIRLIDAKGNVREEDFERLGSLQRKYDVSYHLHYPYNACIEKNGRKILLDIYDEEARQIHEKLIKNIDQLIQENELFPLIDIHLPAIEIKGFKQIQTEEEALENGEKFFQNLELKSKLALETLHKPYADGSCHLLGYKPEHFTKIIGSVKHAKIGLCIDTGHLYATESSMKDFLDLHYPVFSVHYNGWGYRDSHLVPNRKNVKDAEIIERELLRRKDVVIVFELRNHGYSSKTLKKLVENTLMGILV